MNKDRKLIIAGNWKMNKTVAEALDLVNGLKMDLSNVKEVDIVVCPPFTVLDPVSKAVIGSNIKLGAQTMSEYGFGAYTGEIAAGMLKEFSVRYVILGHSERRQFFGETDALVAKKSLAVHAAALKPIVCVGETLAQREAGQTEAVVGTQVKGSLAGLTPEQMEETVLAYEPVWAIGTGKTASPQDAQAVHAVLRAQLAAASANASRVKIIYGGSMNAANAAMLLAQPDIDGGLIGGASLKAVDFLSIVSAACA